jgi:arylsulfatase
MADTKPNVVMVITDDQGYGDMGCHGNPVARTPNIDSLHAQSVRFTDFHAAPMCTPTRGQLLTGFDAARNGAVNVSSGRTLLRADLTTMPDVFRANGYRTGLFGKWHLGDNYPYRPQDRGFDESLWFPSSHISSLPDFWENDYFDDVYCRNGTRERHSGYCTEVFFREAMTWIEARAEADEPFFAYLPTNAPHAPLFVPPEDREAIEAAFAESEHALPEELRNELTPENRGRIIRFLAMIRNLDTYLGELRGLLRTRGIERNTLFIFMTDNGSTFGPLYYNAGMRGAKCSLWEGGHRVPCFMYWPDGGLGEPRDVEGLTQVQDLLPTLIDLCDLESPDTPTFDGTSLASVLRTGEPVPDRILAVNYSRMPFTDYPTPDSESVMRREGAAVLWRRWRLLEDTALYDLQTDPHQDRNVIDEHPDVARTLQQALKTWWEAVEPVANELQRITIGSDAENPMTLSACEWADVFVDQQRQVRTGVRKNSYWHLNVHHPGTYRFALRRWPEESGLALTEACTATELTDGALEAGNALPIAQARMMIARRVHTQAVAAGERAAAFTVQLEAGPTLLHTWFDDERGQPLCGAYYVSVERLN